MMKGDSGRTVDIPVSRGSKYRGSKVQCKHKLRANSGMLLQTIVPTSGSAGRVDRQRERSRDPAGRCAAAKQGAPSRGVMPAALYAIGTSGGDRIASSALPA